LNEKKRKRENRRIIYGKKIETAFLNKLYTKELKEKEKEEMDV
jgi:hypothetical protein